MVLPPLQDQCSVLYAATEIVQALAERRLKRRDAATLLFGLRLTANLMSHIEKAADKAIREGTFYGPGETPDGESIGEQTSEHLDCDIEELSMEDAKALLATLQTTSVDKVLDKVRDKVLDQWQAKHPPCAPKPKPERHPAPSHSPGCESYR